MGRHGRTVYHFSHLFFTLPSIPKTYISTNVLLTGQSISAGGGSVAVAYLEPAACSAAAVDRWDRLGG